MTDFRLPKATRQFHSDRSGVAAVEFALILPVAVAIMALVVYGGELFRVQRKVSLGAATVANLVAQGGNTATATISASQMTQILAYPDLLLFPFDPTQAVEVVVSQVQVTVASGVVTSSKIVGWWATANAKNAGVTPACNQQVTVDSNIVSALAGSPPVSGTYYVIRGQVFLPFQPYDLFGSVAATTLHDSVMMVPRTNTQIIGPSPNGC